MRPSLRGHATYDWLSPLAIFHDVGNINFLAFRFIFANNDGMAITRRQREVYDFISRFVTENGYSPSFEEIGHGLKLNSLATVHKHISNLEKKGLLTRDYNRSRSIDLLPPKGKLKQSMSVNTGVVLPLLGRIAAGQPIEAVENPETISLADFVRSKEVFVLEVRGEFDAGRSDPRWRLRAGGESAHRAQRRHRGCASRY